MKHDAKVLLQEAAEDLKAIHKGQIESLKKLIAGESTQLNPKISGSNKPKGNLDGELFRRMLLLNFND